MIPVEEIVKLLQFDGLLEELERKTDPELRIKITLHAIEDALPLGIKNDSKDNEVSKNKKLEADILLREEKGGRVRSNLRALELYSRSIAAAENSSLRLALAYANRSCVLYHLHRIEECVRDIDRALALPYPDDKRYNLIRRKVKCLKQINKLDMDKLCEEARQSIEKLTITDEKKELLEEKIVHATKASTLIKEEHNVPTANLPKIVPHKNIPSACSAVDIKYSHQFGKHLVANRKINAGEVVVVEEPYSAILNPDNYFTNCSHCFRRMWDSIPCNHCIYTMYCSEKCRSKAWQEYHDIECPLKGYLVPLKMTDLVSFSLKLAILAVRECGNIQKLKKNLEDIDNCKDYIMKSLSKDGVYYSDKYRPIYNLITHEKDRSQYEILSATLNASLILYYMFTLTSFFGENSDKSVSALLKNDDALFFGKLLMQHFMIVQMNDNGFIETQGDDKVNIAFTIGSVTSLLNYSCHPNVGKCSTFKNGTMEQVIFALYPIEEGSMLTDDFFNNFAFVTKAKREAYTKEYFFKCSCIACNESWPLMEELPPVLKKVTDKEDKVEVARAIIRSYEYERHVFKLGLKDYPGDVTKILTGLAESVTILYDLTKKPSKEYFTMVKLHRDVFNFIHGYKTKV